MQNKTHPTRGSAAPDRTGPESQTPESGPAKRDRRAAARDERGFSAKLARDRAFVAEPTD